MLYLSAATPRAKASWSSMEMALWTIAAGAIAVCLALSVLSPAADAGTTAGRDVGAADAREAQPIAYFPAEFDPPAGDVAQSAPTF